MSNKSPNKFYYKIELLPRDCPKRKVFIIRSSNSVVIVSASASVVMPSLNHIFKALVSDEPAR